MDNERIGSGNGTMGKLLNDALYYNLPKLQRVRVIAAR
jgi:hypothetical protein